MTRDEVMTKKPGMDTHFSIEYELLMWKEIWYIPEDIDLKNMILYDNHDSKIGGHWAAAGRFLARTMCDPVRAGVAAADDPLLSGMGALSLGGAYWRGRVDVVDLGLDEDASVVEWEKTIERVGGGANLLFTDRWRYESGRVGGG